MLIYAQRVYEQLFSQKSFHVVYINYFILAGIAVDQYCERLGCPAVEPGYAYNSGTNPDFLTVEQLRLMIQHEMNVAL